MREEGFGKKNKKVVDEEAKGTIEIQIKESSREGD